MNAAHQFREAAAAKAGALRHRAVIQKNIAKAKTNPELAKYAALLEEASNACIELTMFFAQSGKSGDFLLPVLNACKFLEIFGDVIVGHFLIEAAQTAAGKLDAIYEANGASSIGKQKGLQRSDKEAAFYSGRIASAKFFANDILTTVKARCESVKMARRVSANPSANAPYASLNSFILPGRTVL